MMKIHNILHVFNFMYTKCVCVTKINFVTFKLRPWSNKFSMASRHMLYVNGEILKIPLCMHQISGSRQFETGVELKISNKIKVFLWRALRGILPTSTKFVQKIFQCARMHNMTPSP